MMWFDINFYVLAVQLLPTFMRFPAFAAFVQVLNKPLDTLYYNWYNFRIESIYRMTHTGQVCYLRKSLNDKFDPVERRIYIGEGNEYSDVILYTEAENMAACVPGTESEPQYEVWLHTDDEMDSDLDFIVWVPNTVYLYQYHAVKAHIEFYRQGGRRYAIFII